jgi:sRNA-binding carbon storage regulator CsrA
MYIFSFREGEYATIGSTIRVRVLKTKPSSVRLGFEVPSEIPIHITSARGEQRRTRPSKRRRAILARILERLLR